MNAFDILREANERQRQGELSLDATSSSSHPALSNAATTASVRRIEPTMEPDQPTATTASVEIERVDPSEQLRGDRPFWANAAENSPRQPFYAPVVIEAQPHRVEEEVLGAFQRGAAHGRSAFAFALSFNCTRPRVLLALIAIVFACLVGWNWSSRTSAAALSEARAEQTKTLEDALALLHKPPAANPATAVAQAAASAGKAPASFSQVAAAGDAVNEQLFSPGSVEEYVKWAEPRLVKGGGPVGALPSEVAARPLPEVPAGARLAQSTNGAAPPFKKRPVPDTINPPRKGASRTAGKRASGAAATPAVSEDPLASLYVTADVEGVEKAPYVVSHIREQQGGLRAFVQQPGAKDARDGIWVGPGTVFADGWALVGVEREDALFMSPRGAVVTVSIRR